MVTAKRFIAGVGERMPPTPPKAGPSNGVAPAGAPFFNLPMMRWAMAALLLGVAGGSYWQHQQNERIAGERAFAHRAGVRG